MRNSSGGALPAIVPVDRRERIPLSFAQERLWFLAQLDPAASRAYHIPFGMPIKGEVDAVALRRALDEIVARHEALRTTFTAVDEEPVQRIAPADSGFQLVEHDLRGAEDAAGELKRLSAQEMSAPFDLEAGPLVRGRLITLGARRPRAADHDASHRVRRLVDGRVLARAARLVRGVSRGRTKPAGALGGAIRRLCGVAAPLDLR